MKGVIYNYGTVTVGIGVQTVHKIRVLVLAMRDTLHIVDRCTCLRGGHFERFVHIDEGRVVGRLQRMYVKGVSV